MRAFRKAWIAGDGEAMGGLLGYPPCCRAFFREVLGERGWSDPAWIAALATPGAEVDGRSVTVTGPVHCNLVLRRLGLRAAPHLPCSFACEPSAALGRAITDLGEEIGQAGAIADLLSMLDWSFAWTALHGAAEIRTPVLKLVTQTDATAERLSLRRVGAVEPEAAARGLDFPYRSPPSRARA